MEFKNKMAACFLTVGLVLSCFIATSCGNNEAKVDDSGHEPENIPVFPLGFDESLYSVEEGLIRNGDNFIGLMTKMGLDHSEAYDLSQVCDSTFDVRKIRIGNSWKAYYTVDSLANRKILEYMVYQDDFVHSTVFKCQDSLAIWKYSKPVESERKTAQVTINSSLWNDMLAAGASPLLILSLSDIYAWTVDFFGLQKDDQFKVAYSQTVCDGKVMSVDSVFYAVFSRGDQDFPAIMFDQGDGGNVYWNEKGESMRKAFLKAPLKFTRISSGFSMHRKHPVTGKVRPHTGVDYAAPTGTPVLAIGDGTVIAAGYGACGNGGGNAVKIRHNSVYTSASLHLSRYGKGIKSGARVHQGQIIGYVGATGQCTGPHLDFRIWKNGSPINPLKLESPPSEPLKSEFKAEFDSLYLSLQHKYW